MTEHPVRLPEIYSNNKLQAVEAIEKYINHKGFQVVERDIDRPWGAFFKISDQQIETFINEFFPGLSLQAAKQGIENAKLSPKLLLVSPNQRLSWQYHFRRAEKWRFLTSGAYMRSETDEETEISEATTGEVVQFAKGERHRLIGLPEKHVIVAEIWQHSDPSNPSDEADIVRLQDDYKRT